MVNTLHVKKVVIFDFQEPYLRHILSLMGLQDITFIHVEQRNRGEELAHQARVHATEQIEDFIESLTQLAA